MASHAKQCLGLVQEELFSRIIIKCSSWTEFEEVCHELRDLKNCELQTLSKKMALNLHLRNLSDLANNVDIRRFFNGFDIPVGGVSIIGGVNGDAFVSFNGEDQLLRALSLDRQTLLGQPVRLFLSKKSSMEEVLAKRELQKTTSGSSSVVDYHTLNYMGLPPVISTADFPRQKCHPSGSPTRLNLDDISSDEESSCGHVVKRRRMGENQSFVDNPDRKGMGIDERESPYRIVRNRDELIRHDSSVEHSDGYVRQSCSMGSTPLPVSEPGFVRACNLPITATATDIRKFFDGHTIDDGGIILQASACNPGTLIAYLKFVHLKDAIRADCIFDGFKLHGRRISVTMISQLVFDSQALPEGPNQHSVQPYRPIPDAYTYPLYGHPPPLPTMHYPPPIYYPPASQEPPLYSANFSPEIYTKTSEPCQEPQDIQCELPKTYFMGKIKSHLMFNPEAIERMEYYRISYPQNLSPLASSASKLWSIFGGPDGLCVGVIITHMKNGEPEEAMLAYRSRSARDSAKMCPGARKVKGVRYICNGTTMLGVLKQLALRSQSMFVSTVAGPDVSISYQDQQRLGMACIKNKIGIPRENRKAMLVRKNIVQSVLESKEFTYLRFVNLRADITACEIWGWFNDIKGPSSGVHLVRNTGGQALYAYVAIHDFIVAQESFLEERFQKDRYKICNQRSMLHELLQLDSTYEVVESTEMGKDKVVSMYGKGKSSENVTKEATPKPITEMVNSVATPGVDSRDIAKREGQSTKADGKPVMPVATAQKSTIEVGTTCIIDKPETNKMKREPRPTSNPVCLK